ncbi:hypothetical protein [Shewanella acanthi]|uniref:hypothetical protein n=1 Tax=Shewanella acanthi TaxID=2864212 RepID=UPI001C65F502|nr:hypothetical protein [Shewanella acanthi]QYJ78938.1 hypothetical protein K0H61_00290 [Shewanella acanthi]
MSAAKLTFKSVSACVALGLLLTPQVLAADAPAAPMMAPSYFDAQREALQQPQTLIEVSQADFKRAYRKAGSPKIVFLIGERFDDVISDWYSNHRVNVTATNFGQKSGELPEYQQVTVANEYRVSSVKSRNSLLSEGQWQEYERGFNNELLAYGVKPINRNVALRLLDAQLRDKKQIPQDDNHRSEMDMLRTQGKVLFEITPYQDRSYRSQALGYHVLMTSLVDATLLADKRVSLSQGPLEYRASDNGYSLQTPEKFVAVEPGNSGYDIIEDVSDDWEDQGRKMAQVSLQLIYNSGLI